jgi:NAD(P)-dependent dehydrogenase (short-subunit alcohol dehydrogenase family)
MKGAGGTGPSTVHAWGTLCAEGAELTVTGPAASAAPLDGRTVVITGASDGIGAAAARQVAGLGARVIVVGRSAHKTAAVAESIGATALTGDFARRPYRQFAAYADSKLASILFVRELARRGADGGPAAAAFHPGFVLSQFGRDTWYLSRLNGRWWNRYVARTPEHGAEPLTALAVRPDPHTVNGAYLHRFSRRERLVAAQGRDAQLGRRLWERSAELTGLPG